MNYMVLLEFIAFGGLNQLLNCSFRKLAQEIAEGASSLPRRL